VDAAPWLPFEWDLESAASALPLLSSVGRQTVLAVVVVLAVQLQPWPERTGQARQLRAQTSNPAPPLFAPVLPGPTP